MPKFTMDEIGQLRAAGYTLEEILGTGSPAPDPQPEPQPAPKQDPQPEPQQATKQEPQQEPQPVDAAIQSRLDALDKLIDQVQKANIRGTGFPAPDPQDAVEAALASIINPPDKAGKK